MPTDNRIPPIVFVSRNPIPSSDDALFIPGVGPRERTAKVGGRLLLRRPDGRIETLAGSDRFYDVSDPCVSWDASRVVFSGLVHADSSWRIYEVGIDGEELRAVTGSDRVIDLSQFGAAADRFERYDDFDPCYLPDGRIVFSSTRFPSIASYDGILTSNLFVVTHEGALRRITSERNGGEEPAVDPVTGRLVYARWWVNRDLPSNKARHGITRDVSLALTDDVANIWQAISIRSDGEGMKLYAGYARTRAGLQTYKPAVMDDGKLLSLFSPNTALTGDLGGTGIRWFNPGADFEHPVIGVASDILPAAAEPPYAADAVQLEGQTLLLSLAHDGTDFGIFSCRLDGSGLDLIFDARGTHELEPQPVIVRPIPPIIEEEFPYPTLDLPPTEDPGTYLRNDTFRFDCMNIFTNGPVDAPMPDAPRITTGARIRFFMNVQRQSSMWPDPSIYLKDAEVFMTGGVHEHDIPADVPLFEQVVDSRGDVLTSRDGHFAHVTGMNFDRMGSGTKCVGCHAGHSVLPVPLNGSVAEWINVGPSADVRASSAWSDIEGLLDPERNIVDRRVMTGRDVDWISREQEGAWVTLQWEIPIEVRELILYNIRPDQKENTSISVHDCEIFLYYRNELVSTVRSTGEIRTEGTSVPIPPVDIDQTRIVIRDYSGKIRGRDVSGLAEAEVIGRISQLNY